MEVPQTQMSVCVMALGLLMTILVHPSHAQNTPQDYLNVHNAARAGVGVANIAWNTTLATYAQNYATARMSDCNLVHSGGPYGENLAKGSGSFTGTAASNLWVAEKPNYDYTTNTCATGKVCGHYTQVVWSNSVTVGCGRAQCSSGWWFVICSYAPPGNVANQLPY